MKRGCKYLVYKMGEDFGIGENRHLFLTIAPYRFVTAKFIERENIA